jgi:hypothetical protein
MVNCTIVFLPKEDKYPRDEFFEKSVSIDAFVFNSILPVDEKAESAA